MHFQNQNFPFSTFNVKSRLEICDHDSRADRISKKSWRYCRGDGRADSGGERGPRARSAAAAHESHLHREAALRGDFKGRRNKSELSGSALRGKLVFCELQFQSLICSHNKGSIMRGRGNLRSRLPAHKPPPPPPPPPPKPPFQMIGPPHYRRYKVALSFSLGAVFAPAFLSAALVRCEWQ